MDDKHYAVFCPVCSVRPTLLGVIIRDFTKWPPLPATMDNRRRQIDFFQCWYVSSDASPCSTVCGVFTPPPTSRVDARLCFRCCSPVASLCLRVSNVLYVVYSLFSVIEYFYPDITVNVHGGNFVNDGNRQRIPIQR